MNLAYNIEQLNLHNTFLTEKKKNVMMDGSFTKIIYSDELMVVNGLSIMLPIANACCEKKHNKTMLRFNTASNSRLIENLICVEQYILDLYRRSMGSDKISAGTLQEHLNNGCVKIYRELEVMRPRYVLRISGVWEDNTRIGLTYKIVEAREARNLRFPATLPHAARSAV